MSKRVLCLMLGTALLAAQQVSGDVIYDNLGLGDSYADHGWAIGGRFGYQTGVKIVSPGDFLLTSVDAPIGKLPSVFPTKEVALSLYTSDDDDGMPGTVLESSTLADPPDWDDGGPPSTFVFSGTTMLERGDSYFLIASTVENGSLGWHDNDTGDFGVIAIRNTVGNKSGLWGFAETTMLASAWSESPFQSQVAGL